MPDAGTVVPFLPGRLIADTSVGHHRLHAPQSTALEAALFMGSAMRIRAFATLARIIVGHGLSTTLAATPVSERAYGTRVQREGSNPAQ